MKDKSDGFNILKWRPNNFVELEIEGKVYRGMESSCAILRCSQDRLRKLIKENPHNEFILNGKNVRFLRRVELRSKKRNVIK